MCPNLWRTHTKWDRVVHLMKLQPSNSYSCFYSTVQNTNIIFNTLNSLTCVYPEGGSLQTLCWGFSNFLTLYVNLIWASSLLYVPHFLLKSSFFFWHCDFWMGLQNNLLSNLLSPKVYFSKWTADGGSQHFTWRQDSDSRLSDRTPHSDCGEQNSHSGVVELNHLFI